MIYVVYVHLIKGVRSGDHIKENNAHAHMNVLGALKHYLLWREWSPGEEIESTSKTS